MISIFCYKYSQPTILHLKSYLLQYLNFQPPIIYFSFNPINSPTKKNLQQFFITFTLYIFQI